MKESKKSEDEYLDMIIEAEKHKKELLEDNKK